MDKKLLILLAVIGIFALFIGCTLVLIDWVKSYAHGIYSRNPTEALLEITAFILYVYFGIRFFNRHFSSLR